MLARMEPCMCLSLSFEERGENEMVVRLVGISAVAYV